MGEAAWVGILLEEKQPYCSFSPIEIGDSLRLGLAGTALPSWNRKPNLKLFFCDMPPVLD